LDPATHIIAVIKERRTMKEEQYARVSAQGSISGQMETSIAVGAYQRDGKRQQILFITRLDKTKRANTFA
jgi:hypothetical protein